MGLLLSTAPLHEERMHRATKKVWMPDHDSPSCLVCHHPFSLIHRRHHCRMCGLLVCNNCSQSKVVVPAIAAEDVRVCDTCMWGKDKVEE